MKKRILSLLLTLVLTLGLVPMGALAESTVPFTATIDGQELTVLQEGLESCTDNNKDVPKYVIQVPEEKMGGSVAVQGLQGNYIMSAWSEAKATEDFSIIPNGCYCIVASGLNAISAHIYFAEAVAPEVFTHKQATIISCAQQADTFLVPRQKISVTAGLAASYGYTYGAEVGADDITALDVLVKLHEDLFDTTAKDEMNTYLAVTSSGWVSKAFGLPTTSGFGFAVDGEQPNDGVVNPTYGEYTGKLINEAVVTDGSFVQFFFNKEDSFFSDLYAWFEQDGASVSSITAYVGDPIALTLNSYSLMTAQKPNRVNMPVPSAKIALIENNSISATPLTITDGDGLASISFDVAGTYVVSAFTSGDGATPIISPWCTITVEEKLTPPVVPSSVPDDWQNDLWLQYDFKSLSIGDTATIFPRRVPQIVTDYTNNNVQRPDFNFEIIGGSSITLDTPKSKDKVTVTAVKAGTTIVKVTYDELVYEGKTFGASSSVNTAYAVFSVGEKGSITPTTSIAQRSYDTIYFHEGNSVNLPFTVTADGAKSLLVTCNGSTLTPESDGSYLAPLENRSNIIGVVATDTAGEAKSFYQVVDARKIELNIKNVSFPGLPLAKGDTAEVSFKGITPPVYKLATIYNPTWKYINQGNPSWSTHGTYAHYTNAALGGKLEGVSTQWDLATKNAITMTFPDAGSYEFTNGKIFSQWWGSALGSDKTNSAVGGSNAGMSDTHDGEFSTLPNFKIDVAETSAAVKVERIELTTKTLTLYRGDKFQISELGSKLGATVYPAEATNQNYSWSSSDQFTLNLNSGTLSAQAVTQTPVTLTATTVDGGKTATCAVTIVERPVNDAQKKALTDKIAEAMTVVEVDGAETAWNVLKEAISKANQTLTKDGLTGLEAEEAVTALDGAIKAYNKAVADLTTFQHTVTQEKVTEGIKVTINFPNLLVALGNQSTTSLKLVYSSNIPNMTTVQTEDCKDKKEDLRTLSFVVPKDISGTFTLTDGYVRENYFAVIQNRPMEVTNKHYQGEMPAITFTVDNGGTIVPPTPTEKETVTLSIDKLTIGGGYVVKDVQVVLKEGDSAWDVTKRILDEKSIAYKFSFSGKYGSVYISSIDGDGEFDHGSGSGWMYAVNGSYPDVGCNAYPLKNGDVITWRYTLNLGNDLGANAGKYPDNDKITDTKPETPSGEKTETLTPTATVTNGTATVTISNADTDKALKAIQKNTATELVIAPKIKGDVSKVSVALPSSSISALSKESGLRLTMDTPVGALTLNAAGLAALAQEGGKTVTLTADRGVDGSVAITVAADGKAVNQLSGGLKVAIPVPDTLKTPLARSNVSPTLVAALVEADGTLTVLPKSLVSDGVTYALLGGSATVTAVNRLAVFSDVPATHWAAGAVGFAASHGLFQGSSADRFDAEEYMSRAMLVTVLHRLENSPAATGTDFTDIPADAWYADAVSWAGEQGIVTGSAGGFAPDVSVTREQLAAFLYRYAKAAGLDTAVNSTPLTDFSDGGLVSDWAKDGMTWAVSAGLLTGKGGQRLDPAASATRGEVAALMERMITLLVK